MTGVSFQRIVEQATRGPCALVTVLTALGSTPREAGARMLVDASGLGAGSIGGGRLEYDAIEIARAGLNVRGTWRRETRRVILGVDAGQCCGGSVELLTEWLGEAEAEQIRPMLEVRDAILVRPETPGAPWRVESFCTPLSSVIPAQPRTQAGQRRGNEKTVAPQRFDAPSTLVPADVRLGPGCSSSRTAIRARDDERVGAECFEVTGERGARLLREAMWPVRVPVFLYGAGHVARALVQILAGLEVAVSWIDETVERFPDHMPVAVTQCIDPGFVTAARDAPPSSIHLVMTHDHALDFAICRTLLARPDTRLVGLIGSRTKRARFLSRFAAEGLGADARERLICPIGHPALLGVADKSPGAIAIAVAAQVLALRGPAT
jgi:xanthine dehydrogenase accessory factor